VAARFDHSALLPILLRKQAVLSRFYSPPSEDPNAKRRPSLYDLSSASSELSPLHVAAGAGSNSCVRALIEDHGFSPDRRTDSGSSPLHYAAANSRPSTVSLLLSLSADPALSDVSGSSPLHLAAAHPCPSSVSAILSHPSVDPRRLSNVKSVSGRTPLHDACLSDSAEAAKTLADAGGNLGARTLGGDTPLMEACRSEGAAALRVVWEAAGAELDKGGGGGGGGGGVRGLCDRAVNGSRRRCVDVAAGAGNEAALAYEQNKRATHYLFVVGA
jgi:ankyrin repeat protein